MPGLEVKGLSLAVQNVRRSIALIRSEVSGLHDDAWKLQKTLVELREQINKTRDDLKFEAENLGNAPVEELPDPPDPVYPPPDPPPKLAAPHYAADETIEAKVNRYRTTNHGDAHDQADRHT